MIIQDSIGNTLATNNFIYNSSNVIQEIHELGNPNNYTFHFFYQYYQNQIIEKIFDSNNVLNVRTAYTLNNLGFISSGQQMSYNIINGDSTLEHVFEFKYDSDGYLIEKKDFLNGDTSAYKIQTWQISNENIISSTVTQSNIGLMYTENYEYYSNSSNTIGNSNLGISYEGKSSKNLIKTSVIVNNPQSTQSYSYIFDSQNRVISSTVVQHDGTFLITYAYY